MTPIPISIPPDVFRFSDWPISVPKLPGTYAIWRGSTLIYAGEAGSRWKPQKPGSSHLKLRLSHHANANRSDVFTTYVFERFIGRHLPEEDWTLIERGVRHMTDYAKKYIRNELSFSFATTSNHTQALEWENRIRYGELGSKPVINPL